MPSIRQRISVAFYAFVAVVALLSALAVSDLRYLEWRIGSGTAIGDFLRTVLELRRYEKNLFLYETRSDLDTARDFLARARQVLDDGRDAFVALDGAERIADIEQALGRYRTELDGYGALSGAPAAQRLARQDTIRNLGRLLAESAEAMAREERDELADAVKRAQTGLIVAVVVVAVLGIGAARGLSRTAVRPIAWIEAKMAAIGEGHFNRVEPVSRDQEIVSMSRAVNRMLTELEARNRQLVQSEKLASLGTLVSGVAHELNNPLSNISTSCQIVIEELEQQSGADPLEWLRQIDEETERARRIVQILLEFSRERRFELSTVRLRRLIERALVLLGRRRRARVVLEVPPELVLRADPQRLQQVVVNLVSNALDAGGDEVQIRISASAIEAGEFVLPEGAVAGRRSCPARGVARAVVIEFEDDGPGIPPEVLPRIFDPFFTTKEVGHGSGLGLYVSEEIVDQHDGCIAVASRPGAGTRFFICLPQPEDADEQ